MEPIIFVVLAAIMGGTLIAVYMPMSDMINMAGTSGYRPAIALSRRGELSLFEIVSCKWNGIHA